MTFISNDIFHQKDNGILGETVTDPEGYFSIQANYPGTGTIDISHEYNQTTSNSFVHNYPIPYDDVKVIDFGKIYETVSFYAVAKITAIGTYKPNDTLFFGPPSDVMAIYPIVPNHEYIRVFGVSLVGVNFVLQDTFNIGAAIGIGKRIYDSAWKNMTRTHGLKLTGSLCTTHDTSRFVIP
ncbi:MAG: hypothetical protein ABI169_08985 [Chitinophagaceae bacterium]